MLASDYELDQADERGGQKGCQEERCSGSHKTPPEGAGDRYSEGSERSHSDNKNTITNTAYEPIEKKRGKKNLPPNLQVCFLTPVDTHGLTPVVLSF